MAALSVVLAKFCFLTLTGLLMQSALDANFINFSMLKIMENLSLIDVCSTIQSALFGIPESEKQRICKVFEESKIDGLAVAALRDIGDLIKVVPSVAPGYVIRIYSSLKCLEEDYNGEVEQESVPATSTCTNSISDISDVVSDEMPLDQTTPGTSTNFVSDFTNEISDEVPLIQSTTDTSTNSVLDISSKISSEAPLIRTTSFMPGPDLAKAVLQSETPSESTTADENTGTDTQFSETTKQPNLPVPKEFPVDLCQFDYYGKELIRTGILTERGKRQILSEIVRVMNMFESHPGRELRRKAVDALVNLGKAQLMLSKEEAKKFWLHKISQKINANAKRLRKFQNQHAAQKSKQSSNNLSGVSSTISPKRKTSFTASTFQDSNIEQKKQLIQEEMKKPVQLQRKKVIQEWMHETYNARRSYVTSKNPTPALIREQWPALLIYDELILEMRRMKNFASEREIRSEARNIFCKVISFAKAKMRKSSGLVKVLDQLPMCELCDMSLETLVVMGCWTLCELLKSNTKKLFPPHRYFIDIYPINTTIDEVNLLTDRHQPVLIIYGRIRGGLKIEKLMLHSEKRLLLEVDDVLKGLMAFFAYHYAANYEYSPHVKKVCEFLEEQLLKSATASCSAVKELVMYLQSV